jgi:hypothetical protein
MSIDIATPPAGATSFPTVFATSAWQRSSSDRRADGVRRVMEAVGEVEEERDRDGEDEKEGLRFRHFWL